MKIIILAIIGLGMLAVGLLGAVKRSTGYDLEPLMRFYADHYSIEYALVKAVAKVESNLNQDAKNPSDPSYGLMQITPILAQDYGYVKDWKNPTPAEIAALMNVNNNLDIGCHYLSDLLEDFLFEEAVQMYNVGRSGYLNGKRNYDYLDKVRKYYEIYQ